MFHKICIQQQKVGNADNPLDLGFLAEAMLFYGSVEILANRASMSQLVREFGADLLGEYLMRDYLRITFEPNFTGILTENGGTPTERHSPIVAEIQGQQLIDVLKRILIEAVGKPGKGRRLALRLSKHIQSAPVDEALRTRTATDLLSSEYVREAIRKILEMYIPANALPPEIEFEAIPLGEERFHVRTNLDFRRLNDIYHQRIPSTHSSLDVGYLLSVLMTSRKMLEDGARIGAELAVDPIYREVITTKIQSTFCFREQSAAQIEAFQCLVFKDGKRLSAVLESKERTFADLLAVLDRAAKFRNWLHEEQISSDLVRNYFHAVTEQSWIDKLPTKTMRWSFFTGAGLLLDALGGGGLGTAAGLALSAGDAFLLDKLVKGWKPNQFVDNTLQTFVNRGDT